MKSTKKTTKKNNNPALTLEVTRIGSSGCVIKTLKMNEEKLIKVGEGGRLKDEFCVGLKGNEDRFQIFTRDLFLVLLPNDPTAFGFNDNNERESFLNEVRETVRNINNIALPKDNIKPMNKLTKEIFS